MNESYNEESASGYLDQSEENKRFELNSNIFAPKYQVNEEIQDSSSSSFYEEEMKHSDP
jgi:hypothetical protein